MDGSRTNIILVLGSITKVDRSLRESSKPTYLGKLSDPLRQYPSMDVTGRIEFQKTGSQSNLQILPLAAAEGIHIWDFLIPYYGQLDLPQSGNDVHTKITENVSSRVVAVNPFSIPIYLCQTPSSFSMC